MKKKMLIVGISMMAAGTESAFLDYASKIDYNKYDVDLLLAKKEGLLLSKVPKEINIIEMECGGDLFTLSHENSKKVIINEYVKKHPLKSLSLIKFLPSLLFNIKNYKFTAFRIWIHVMKSVVKKMSNSYDLAVDFWGDKISVFVAEKVVAKEKEAFLHFEYEYPIREDKTYHHYYSQFDRINIVSKRTLSILEEKFSDIKDRFVYWPNEINIEKILEYKNKDSNIPKDGFFNILTIGRINRVKGYDLVLPGIRKLVDEGYKIHYYICGMVDDKEYNQELNSYINENNINSNVSIMQIDDPFLYMNGCDLYIQPSYSESGARAAKEATVLCDNIIVTDFEASSEVYNMAKNKVEICQKSSESIYNNIKKIICKNK